MITTVAAFVLAFLVGAVLMIVSDTEVRSTFTYFFARPSDAIVASLDKVGGAYGALIAGSIGGYGPITETTAQAAPLICAGLGVALAFRAGLFNIGAQGQAIIGSMFAAYVGFSFHLPPGIHLLLAVVAGLVGGAIWGGLVGWLKAGAGAHEVIVTIMLNYVAAGRARLRAHDHRVPAPGPDRPDLADRGLERDVPAAGRRPAAPRLRARDPGRGRPSGGCSSARPPASPSARSGPTRTPRRRPA